MFRSKIVKAIYNPLGRLAFNRYSPSRSFAVVTIPLESLGDSITTATVVAWSKKPGDAIKTDDVIAVVETDKVTMDIRGKIAGTFLEGLCADGAEIAVGAPLYKMDDVAVASTSVAASAKPQAPVAAAPVAAPAAASAAAGVKREVPVPTMGESITQGVLREWTVKVGDSVKSDQVVGVIETDKVTVDIRSPFAGRIDQLKANSGDEVEVGQLLFVVQEGAAGASSASAPAAKTETKSAAPVAEAAKPAPAAAKKDATAPAVGAGAASANPAKPTVGTRSESRVKLTRMRLRISDRLKDSQNTAALLTTFQECDMSNLIRMRNEHKDEFEKVHKVKLGFMSAFVKASTGALLEIPAVNAVIDNATSEVVYRNYVDISVAVASPTGLVVPVLRNTELMSFADVEKTIGLFGKKAKEGTMTLEDMVGGTFTISNGGTFGSLFGTPIVNQPQSAILGMHATKERAVVVNGQVVARPMMYLALTYDHRLIDGREAVTFLKSVQKKIEDPSRLLLDL